MPGYFEALNTNRCTDDDSVHAAARLALEVAESDPAGHAERVAIMTAASARLIVRTRIVDGDLGRRTRVPSAPALEVPL